MSHFDNEAIVIDNGSGLCKAGFSGDDAPKLVFPSVIGKPLYPEAINGLLNSKNTYVGFDAFDHKGILGLHHPIEHGIINDWNSMELIWENVFDELHVVSNERSVLLTEPPLNPKENREKMAEIMFETFDVPSLYIAIQAVLSLYCGGRITGCVVDSGDGNTHMVPIYEGYALSHAIDRIDLAGRDLNEYLQRLLMERGYNFCRTSEKEIVRDIKERCCYVALNYEQELELGLDKQTDIDNNTYQLPDGQIIELGNERFRCPEALFQPNLVGLECAGLHTKIYNSLSKCDVDVRRDLYSNILLAGGTTLFNNFTQRLAKEIALLTPASMKPKLCAPAERKYTVWLGGSILGSLTNFSGAWVTKAQYKENGVNVVHRFF